ncbi:hypothetical protein AW736_17790 [Termitidicoccus mucosus]|uniref:Uncharacterized protein n=1 Tax=Termitidicoccus mucosus TaxID=1184151 RepID=A0A178IFR2_9BACT|nr:hypothetical protein AW736_17790 [Opitutaceae bacterium TSB47]
MTATRAGLALPAHRLARLFWLAGVSVSSRRPSMQSTAGRACPKLKPPLARPARTLRAKNATPRPLQTDSPDGIEKTPATAMMPPPGARAPRPQTTRAGQPSPLQKASQRRQPPFRITGKTPTDGKATGGRIRAIGTQQQLMETPKIPGQKWGSTNRADSRIVSEWEFVSMI